MNGREQISLVLIIACVITLGSLVGSHLYVYSGEPYEVTVIRSHLLLALDTHNVEDKVQYIDDTVKSLEKFNGNGNWWFPTESTDIDRTRELLQSVSQDIYEQRDVKTREGYFILPHNELIIYLNSEITESNKRLINYQNAIYWNPNNDGLLIWILIPLFPTLGLLSLMFGLASDDYSYRDRWDEKQLEKKQKKEAQKKTKLGTLPKGF